MRRLVPAVLVFGMVFVARGVAQTGNADAVMAAARAALGGETKIAGGQELVVTGRTRQVRGDNLVPIEFEIQAELPDKYSRRDEFPAQDAGPVTPASPATRRADPAAGPPPPRPGDARRRLERRTRSRARD